MPPGQTELIVARTLVESAISQAVEPQQDTEIGLDSWVFSALWWLAIAGALLLVRQLRMLVSEQRKLAKEDKRMRHDFDNCPHRPKLHRIDDLPECGDTK